MKKELYGVVLLVVVMLAAGTDAQAQILWTRDMPLGTRVDAGALLDVNIPGFNQDVVILGISVLGNTTSTGSFTTTYVAGLNTRTGVPVYVKALPLNFSNTLNGGVLSIKPLEDRNGDSVQDALVSVKIDPAMFSGSTTHYVEHMVINGLTGDLLGTRTYENAIRPVTRNNQFDSIIGDYNADGKKDEALIRLIDYNPLYPTIPAKVQAIR